MPGWPGTGTKDNPHGKIAAVVDDSWHQRCDHLFSTLVEK
jgi:hypothetical protein